MKKKMPESYLKRMEQLRKSGGVVQEDIFKDELRDLKNEARLSAQYERLTPENVKQVIEDQKEIESKFKEAQKIKPEIPSISKSVPKDKVYNKLGKLLNISEAIGSRGLKSLPVIGLGLGLASAAKAAKEGDYKKAGLEALSAIDPTPLTDIYLASQEIGDLLTDKSDQKTEQQKLKETVSPMIKEVGGEPDIKPEKAEKMLGEKESKDIEDMTKIINYEDYLNKRKKEMGY